MENQRTILVIVCPLGKDHPSLLPGGRGNLKIDFSKLVSIVAIILMLLHVQIYFCLHLNNQVLKYKE